MDLGAIFIGMAILIVSMPYVLNPLVNERKRQPGKAASLEKGWKGEQKDALAAIRDLDFDFQTGKVTREDYETIRVQLVLEAAGYLQMKQQEDERIEAMIRARRQQGKPSVHCEKCGGEIRTQDLICPTCGVPVKGQSGSTRPVSEIHCPGCGKNIKEGDSFCTGCGMRLSELSTPGNVAATHK